MGGKLYDLPPNSPNGACVTLNQAGWAADTDADCDPPDTFTRSSWRPGALNPGGVFNGHKAYLEVAYATDPLAHGWGFDFDQVSMDNFDLQTPDHQVCNAPKSNR